MPYTSKNGWPQMVPSMATVLWLTQLCGAAVLFPFGPDAGDARGTSGDSWTIGPLPLPAPIPYFGTQCTSYYVNVDGYVYFSCSAGTGYVLVFYTDLHAPQSGIAGVWFRCVSKFSVDVRLWDVMLGALGTDVPLAELHRIRHVSIVTWDGLPCDGNAAGATASFQLIIPWGASSTYVVMRYNRTISCSPLVRSEIWSSNSQMVLQLPYSGTTNAYLWTTMSNTPVPTAGHFAFAVENRYSGSGTLSPFASSSASSSADHSSSRPSPSHLYHSLERTTTRSRSISSTFDQTYSASGSMYSSDSRSATQSIDHSGSSTHSDARRSRSETASETQIIISTYSRHSQSVMTSMSTSSSHSILRVTMSVTDRPSPSITLNSASKAVTSSYSPSSRTGTPSFTTNPCDNLVYNDSDSIVSTAVVTVDGAVLATVENQSVVLSMGSVAFEAAGSVTVTVTFRAALRNFGGNVSKRWFTEPAAQNCKVSEVELVDLRTMRLSFSHDAGGALFRLPTDSYRCAAVFSSDVFECQLLTGLRFNPTIAMEVTGVQQLPYWVTLVSQALSLTETMLMGGQSLLQQSRTSSIASLASCRNSLVQQPDLLSHPLQFGFGSSPQYYRRGVVVGNVLLLLVIPGLKMVAAYAWERTQGTDRVLKRFCFIYGPTVFFTLLQLLFGSLTEASVSLLLQPWDSGDVVLGALGCLCVVALFIGVLYGLVTVWRSSKFVAAAPLRIEEGTGWAQTLFCRAMHQRGVVELVEGANERATYSYALLRLLLNDSSVVPFPCLDYSLTLLINAMVGAPRLACGNTAYVMLGAVGAYLMALIYLHPSLTLFELVLAIVREVLSFTNCALLTYAMRSGEQSFANAMRFVGLASYVVMWVGWVVKILSHLHSQRLFRRNLGGAVNLDDSSGDVLVVECHTVSQEKEEGTKESGESILKNVDDQNDVSHDERHTCSEATNQECDNDTLHSHGTLLLQASFADLHIQDLPTDTAGESEDFAVHSNPLTLFLRS